MNSDSKFNFRKRKKLTTVLGLVLDGSRLDGVVLRRTNGALQRLHSFSAQLTLDPLTAAPELVGREIRNQLDAAGVRERDCIVGVPLKWVLTAHTELPPLPEADAAQIEGAYRVGRVLERQEHFFVCQGCDRVYWAGTPTSVTRPLDLSFFTTHFWMR